MKPAERISAIPPYLFAELDKKKAEVAARGVDLIDLGVGDPDRPTPEHIVEAMRQAVGRPKNHQYPSYVGSQSFRQTVADWYGERFDVSLDPDEEVMALIGSKEGLAHVVWAFVDPGDGVLVPDPAYPVYRTHTLLAGGTPHMMPLLRENGFLPDLDAVPAEAAAASKLLFINYPNNPTAGVAGLDFFQQVVDFAREHELVVCHDAAYTEISFDGYRAPSILQVPGAKEVAIEFNSLSKPFNMTGWRIAFAAGGSHLLRALGIIKTNTDSGQFTAIEEAAIHALTHRREETIAENVSVYAQRRDAVMAGLKAAGIDVTPTRGSFYVWAPVPDGYTSASFCEELLTGPGIVVSPGSAYGPAGEGYFRIALTEDLARIREAMERLRQHLAG